MSFFDRAGSTAFARYWAEAPSLMVKNHDKAGDAQVASHLAASVLGGSGSLGTMGADEPGGCAASLGVLRKADEPVAFDGLANALGCVGSVVKSQPSDSEALIANSWGITK